MSSAHGIIVCAVCAAGLLVGCQSASIDGAWSKNMETQLVHQQLQKIVRCPFLFSEQGKLHVMAIGEIENNTTLVGNDNIEFMKAQIASKLTNSGVVMISTAENGRISPPHGGNAIAPTLKLNGKLTQRDSRDKEGRLQHEFALELSIIELATGVRRWSYRSVVAILDNGRISHCERVVTKFSQWN